MVNHLWLVTTPRFVLGFTFAAAAINYFWQVTFGRALFPTPITDRAKRFAGDIIAAGYLWPLMKLVNLTAGILLISNQAPAFALALLSPITVVIVWFQIILNPLPTPLATTAVVVVCESLLFHAYAACYIGLFSISN
jgi:putative oxidoreductase